jgi:predicted nucleotidyltransferase
MYLDKMFEKYMDWKLLRLFLQYPDQGFYTKEIARKMTVGAGTVNIFLRNFHESDLLTKEVVGNVHVYRLNNESEIIKHLKTLHTLLEIQRYRLINQILSTNATITSIILYGSHANGENDSKSDIDLLLILNEKKSLTSLLQPLEKKLKKPIAVQMMTIPEWQQLKVKDKIFYESILEKHILLSGSGLP